MFKKEKGITLIALVITIIVLLILAIVSINLALNNNGLFGRARNSTNTYKKAETNEMTSLNEATTIIDNEIASK